MFILKTYVLRVRIHCALLSVFQTAIANASTLAEVERLKGLLQAGQIPGRERKPGHALLLLLVSKQSPFLGRAKQWKS